MIEHVKEWKNTPKENQVYNKYPWIDLDIMNYLKEKEAYGNINYLKELNK